PTPTNQCWPAPPPYVLNHMEIQILQRPDRVLILYLLDHQVRHIYLNATHSTPIKRSWYGESVGRYEGDTLVVDTVGVKAAPFPRADDYGTPNSENLHVVERYRLIDGQMAKAAMERNERENGSVPPDAEGIVIDPSDTGKGLQIQVTVEDEGVFTTQW